MIIPPYVPGFTHTDWIDNEDRVQAGGENGFNIRFHNLESEFRTLAVDHLNPVINALSTAVTCLTLSPILTPNRPDLAASTSWEMNLDVAQKQAGATEAHGIMNVNLPQGATLLSMLVTGAVPKTAALAVILFRKTVTPGPGSDTLITAGSLGTPAATPAPGAPTIVDNATYKYFIEANVTGAASTDMVQLACFQITYQ
ncbi:hypothetical protein [Kitasatospora sp. LaBMicrA B282]|uniref:hypothetical protein n=1 Tax=Kitasatospora sp. LaBMicrA B282 TaxID=3420949 RepID=UPI003D109CB4